MNIPWYGYGLLAATIWGVHYLLLSRAMAFAHPITAYWLPTVIMILGLPFFYKDLLADFTALPNQPLSTQISFGLIAFTSMIASLSLYKAIQLSNPVSAGLIEITFPFFVAVFALLLFGENHFNTYTIAGSALIFSGTSLIIYNS